MQSLDNVLERFDWFNYSRFYDFISEKKFNVLVELGVWKGHSVSYLAEKNRNSEIYAVDLWEDMQPYPHYHKKIDQLKKSEQTPKNLYKLNLLQDHQNMKKIYNEYLESRGTRHIINDIQSDAGEASKLFNNEEVDFIFIDLWPTSFRSSILNDWHPKIKKNGIISGHDFNEREIAEKVKDFALKHKYNINVEKEQKVWWITK